MLPVTSGLVMHLDTASLSLSDGQAVDVWGSEDEALVGTTQTTAGAQPVYVAGAMAGKGAVRFDGVDDQLLLSENLFGAGVADSTVFVVYQSSDFKAHILGAAPESSGTLTTEGYAVGIAAGKAYFKAMVGGSGARLIAPSAAMDMSPSLVATRISASTTELMSGCQVVHGAQQPMASAYAASFLGGAGTEFFSGDVASVVVYNRVLSDSELHQVRDFLSARYGAYVAAAADTDADGTFDACDTGATYLTDDTASVTLIEPDESALEGTPANIIDLDSPLAFDPHNAATHVFNPNGRIVARIDLGGTWFVEQVHFWNFNGERDDTDTLTLAFYSASDTLVDEVVLTPNLGFEDILAEDFLVNIAGVSYVVVTAEGGGTAAEFMNIGFSVY